MKTGHKDHLLSTSAKSSEKLTFPKPLTRKDASVLKIKEARNSSDCFSFKLVTIEDICKEIRALDASKATQSDDIPTTFFPTFFLELFKRILIALLKQVLSQSN